MGSALTLFPSESAGFGFGAISSAVGFFLCDFFGTPLSALACFAGCFALVGMLTHRISSVQRARSARRASRRYPLN